MIEIAGKFNTAICYTNELEDTAYSQIESVCNESAFKDLKIRIMPDVHAGKGCTIGTTMTITDKVVNVVFTERQKVSFTDLLAISAGLSLPRFIVLFSLTLSKMTIVLLIE